MAKSVERIKKKVKKEDGEIINEIIININPPTQETSEKKVEKEKKKKSSKEA